MAKAQRDWAEALAARQPPPADEVVAFVDSVAASAATANGPGSAATAAASLEAVVPLALFLSRSLGKVRRGGSAAITCAAGCTAIVLPCKTPLCPSLPLPQFPETVVPGIVAALQAVVAAVEAAAADLSSASVAAAAADAPPGTPLSPAAAGGALPPPKWGLLLSHAVTELGTVLGLLSLIAEWKEQISGAFAALLRQLLAARRAEQQPMLAGFRATLASGRRRLPLTGADAAQVGPEVQAGWAWWATAAGVAAEAVYQYER